MGVLINFRNRTTPAKPKSGTTLKWLKNRIGFFMVVILGALALLYEHGARLLIEPVSGSFHAIDGDSLRLKSREYRLKGIDAPELHQTCTTAAGWTYNCGRDAHAALKRQVDGSRLTCSNEGTDKYGRTLTYCLSGDTDVNGEMVRSGWALAYSGLGFSYWWAELEARNNRRGIWQGTFEPPEAWRERHRLARGGMTSGDDMSD